MPDRVEERNNEIFHDEVGSSAGALLCEAQALAQRLVALQQGLEPETFAPAPDAGKAVLGVQSEGLKTQVQSVTSLIKVSISLFNI